jgi:hypothetical protein
LYVIDRAGDGDVVGDEVRVPERLDVVAHTLLEVREREEVAPRGVHARLGCLAQASDLNLVDKPAHAVLVEDERAGLDTSNRLAHVLFQVGESHHGK